MLSRAKISIFITLVGIVTMVAAPLDVEQKNSVFQPGTGSIGTLAGKATVMKPSQNVIWGKSTLWSGVKIQKIKPAAQAAPQVEINGFTFKKAPEAAVPKAAAQPAGGAH